MRLMREGPDGCINNVLRHDIVQTSLCMCKSIDTVRARNALQFTLYTLNIYICCSPHTTISSSESRRIGLYSIQSTRCIGSNTSTHATAALGMVDLSFLIMASTKNSPARYEDRTSGPDATYLYRQFMASDK
jgi:hypothetical protein